jgi:hypothetical protein
LTASPARAYLAHMEPGKGDFVRLTIAMPTEDERRLLRLKHYLEVKYGKRLSLSEIVRQSIKCYAEVEGVK